MITLEHLQSLYNENKIQECIEATNAFLLFNEENAEALLLKAKCEYELAQGCEIEEDFIAMSNKAYSSFIRVLEVMPENESALIFAAYINVFILKSNFLQAIDFCERLKNSEDFDVRLKAISYKQEAYFATKDADNALATMDELIELNKIKFQDDRSKLDKELAGCYTRKAYIYWGLKKDNLKALKVYTESFEYDHMDGGLYCFIANLAFDNNDYVIGGKAMSKTFFTCINVSEDDLLSLYDRTVKLIENGIENKEMIFGVFIALMKMGHTIFGDDRTIEILQLSKKYIAKYPDWYVPYHYAGGILYFEKSYSEAHPYLKKSIELGGRALGLQRFLETEYYLTDKFPEIKQWPDDLANEYYYAGVHFCEFEEAINDSSKTIELLQLRKTFYEKSYSGFYDYFYKGEGSSTINDIHTFAMCCNNYGIVLGELGEFEKAIEVHELGYSLSPFWEQLNSWGTALMDLELYEKAIEIFTEATSYTSEYLPFDYYLKMKGEILTATYKLGNSDNAQELLNNIQAEYESFIESNKDELSKEELLDYEEIYIPIQNIRSHLLLDSNDYQTLIDEWTEQLQKNPDNASAYYKLMPLYNEIGDFKNVIACADNYLAIKGESIEPSNLARVYHLKGLANIKLDNLAEGLDYLQKLLAINNDGYQLTPSGEMFVYYYLTIATYYLQHWEDCKKYAKEVMNCYNKNEWGYEEELSVAMIYYADACKVTGQNDIAIKTIKNLLIQEPDNAEALRRKKEWAEKGGLFSFFKK